jgi:histidinol-phosphate/aromatic aminotransferase/cobyric acid decarboxylase-like protein
MSITGEDTEERTALETSRLRRVLETHSAGRRVVEVGRGAGRRALGLTRAGFEATGLELEDERAAFDLPLPAADAAIYLPRTGHHESSHQRRLLRRIRRSLTDDGVLVAAAGLSSLVKEAGFAVERVDADFIVARPLRVPPDSLAVTSWRNPESVRLDMRYAPDEDRLLTPTPQNVWEDLVRSAARSGAEMINHYPVDDPYGSERGAATVSRFFDCRIEPRQLTFGAGVTPLLHDLCGLADGGLVAAPALVHGDLEAWALARGGEVRLFPEPATAGELIAELEAARPALLHLDRPNFLGRVLALDELEEVVRAAARVGAAVLIDESAAPYLGPAGSAARLVGRVENLIVLRGHTKAYSWGGLRAGFAVASDGVARDVRELVPPLQISELSLHASLRLLAAGDIFGRLRERVRLMRPQVIELLAASGLDVVAGHADLPWVAFSDDGGEASRILERRGICPLRPAPAPVFPPPPDTFSRITIPLSAERMALFRELLGKRDEDGL